MSRARPVGYVGLIVLLSTGCVDRKFVIESNVPNAQVYIDNKPVGAAPSYSAFEYYGDYTITLVHPGYDTLVKRVHVTAPWYGYPPFDFITEVLWPFHIRDTRRYHFEMFAAPPTRTDDILNAAETLRQRGQTLPAPEHPAQPRPPRSPVGPVIGPPVEPGANPLPPPRPIPTAPEPSVIPRVTPG